MSTPIGRKAKSNPTRSILELPPETHGGAANNAEIMAMRLSSPTTRETALAKVPRGPFKILTIPQAWYDSLHAGHGEGDAPGKDE